MKGRKRMKRVLNILFLVSVSLAVAACGQGTETEQFNTAKIKIYKDNSYPSNGRYIPSDRVDLSLSYNDLSGTLSNNENVFPSKGSPKLLVIPVHVAGGEQYQTAEVKEAIRSVFFGENDEKLGFKSLKEFYRDSSFGQLDIQGTVTDWFDSTPYISDPSQITTGQDGTIISKILTNAIAWAIDTQGVDPKDYDYNHDGSIDGIYLVYDHLDWTAEQAMWNRHPEGQQPTVNQAFWNFTSWDWNTKADLDKPTTSAFSWSSFDMMYTPYAEEDADGNVILDDLASIKLDSHTFIHEFGHLMGLDDYYRSDSTTSHPAGGMTMMDQNVGDLDSYSKMLLGWITPYVVYGTSEITINDISASKNSVIVIPSDFEEISEQVEKASKSNSLDKFRYKFNPFSEYLMIDLYAPIGNYKQDAYGPYLNDREPAMNAIGARIYHIDSRIFAAKIVSYIDPDTGYSTQKFSYTNMAWNGEQLESDEAILMPISNSYVESSSFQLPQNYDFFEQIRMIEANKTNTFDKGEYATNNSLFTTESDPFDVLTFGYQFFNGRYAYNDGADMPFKVKVEEINEVK